MDFAFFKPWLTVLALPPAVGLLIILLGMGLMSRYRSRLGTGIALFGVGLTWLLACNGFAVLMAQYLMPQYDSISLASAGPALRDKQAQAVIVLGGGSETRSREYGSPQPSSVTVARMHYGGLLSRSAGLPLGFSGGISHSAADNVGTEAQAVQRWMTQLGLPALKWSEGNSRDTRENAQQIATLLRKDGVERIALVTHAWHMPRARRAFEAVGMTVTPAPMGFIDAVDATSLEWLPSSEGLRHSRLILREMLGLALGY